MKHDGRTQSDARAIRPCATCGKPTEHAYSIVDARRANWLCLIHQATWLTPRLPQFSK